MRHRTIVTLTLSGDSLPTEFRIFLAGKNKTTKGSVLFDAAAARDVMSAFAEHAVDLMIDLEHMSLDSGEGFNPDAVGWAKLEIRNGELWAVGVRWNEDGAARLRSKRQRYVSPAFEIDSKTKRVRRLVNVALTSLPATHKAQPLIAASARPGNTKMNSKLAAQALEAIKNQDGAKALELLEQLMAGVDPEADAEAEPADDADAPVNDLPETTSERLCRLTGHDLIDDAVGEIEAKLKRLAVVERGERRQLAASLVKLGAETPFTSGLSTGRLCARLRDEPIESLRERVKQLSGGRPQHGGFRPPVLGDDDVGTLSASTIAECKKKKIDPAAVAEIRAAIRARSVRA